MGNYAPASVIADAVAHVRSRRGDGDGDTIVWGSIRLMRSLLAAEVVDELELLIAPGRAPRDFAAFARAAAASGAWAR